MIVPFFARDTSCSPENPYCLSTRSDNNDNATTTPTTTTGTTHTHPLLGHRNLVGVLVIAALLALALVLSLCFAKWSKPIRRFLRREPPSDSEHSSTDDVAAPSTQQGIANDAEMAGVMPDSGSSQSSFDLDAIKEKAGIKVALPAKVRASRYTPRFLFIFVPRGRRTIMN